MKKKILSGLLAVLLLSQAGCVYLVVGGAAALGGYAISPDTIEGVIENKNTQDMFAAAIDVISIMGIIEEKNELAGVIVAKVQKTYVTITIAEPVTDSVKLTIKARRGMMPKIKLAQDIYAKILAKANS